MASCEAIDRRAQEDYRLLQRAWGRLKMAQGRVNNVRNFGRGKKYSPALVKARAAVEQADGEVRFASARIQKTFAAVKKCLRRKAAGTLSGPRRRRRRR